MKQWQHKDENKKNKIEKANNNGADKTIAIH